jgi:hypothetical protein
MKRIAQISFGFSGRFAPGFLPAFHAGPCSTGSYDECPIIILRWPEWPPGEQIWWGFWPLTDDPLTAAFGPLVPLAAFRFRFRHTSRQASTRSQAAPNDKSGFRSELLNLVDVRVHFAQRFHLR